MPTLALPGRRIAVRSGRTAVLRACESLDELGACVRMQGDVWGYEGNDIIPRRAFIVARHIGGQVIGAFEEHSGTLVGFAMALPGVKQGINGEPSRPYLHSHMLAVDPGWRNEGLGQQLKRFQREEALSRGIDHMEWTFDPLEIKNAFLNIHRLGAIVRCYLPDFYGVSSSRLQNGLPTDRLVAEWRLASSRVAGVLAGDFGPIPPIEERMMIPAQMASWKTSGDVARALEVQQNLRKQFQQAFQAGLAVVNFCVDEAGNGIYELAAWPQ
ncbi:MULTISPECIES: GNAT family N-acetyltransferase [Acidobacterium]|uniref:GNAT family N-acetyltransferase n=1 Tax=Acidobacterium TaxID=33973 RepID=UPI0002F6C35D|nr:MULTISPECIES: GNAT family N-acetyltransferase [Acidobacterium]HCT61544.1 GNAT family N-acetyltransferase [Acidobacterium sp.]